MITIEYNILHNMKMRVLQVKNYNIIIITYYNSINVIFPTYSRILNIFCMIPLVLI